jgi:aminopeptidase N
MRHYALIALSILILSSCSQARRAARKGNAEIKNLPEITVSVNDARNQYRASEPILWDITHTRVALSFNWMEKTADGQAWIDIHPYAKAMKTLTLDAKGMLIEKVELEGKVVPHTYNDDKITLTLNRNYLPNEQLKFYIKYKAMPYAKVSGGSAAITDDRGLYFINTDGEIPGKPRQIWTQGETEANSHWMPTIDKPNERMTVQVELTVPDTMQTLGNGVKISSEPVGKGLRTDTWKMDKQIQVYATMFAIGKFDIVKDKWGSREASYYVEHEYAPYAKKMFNNTPEMMEYFSQITGVDYPWQKYDQVVVRDYVSGAMENTTASLYGEFMNQNFREIADDNYEDIVSHELFHQWFGDYVTMESWSNLTVSESFANYGEQLWRKHKYGTESADKLAYNDLQKYLFSRGRSPLVRFNYEDKEDMFDRISYEKGGAILNYLHGLMGDEAFFKAMNIYLTKNALSSTEATHWRLAVEEATGEDWNWFFNQFYLRGGHPNLDVRYNYDDAKQELAVTVTQNPSDSGLAYRLPLKTLVVYGTEKTTTDWYITQKTETFKYPYKNGVKPTITPDMEHWLPGTIKENKGMEHWLVQFNQHDNYISKRLAINEAVKNIDNENAKKLIDNALTDKSALIKAYTLSSISKFKTDAYANRWKSTVEYLAAEDGDNKVRAYAFDMLGTWKVISAKNEMLKALNDSSYDVAGLALKALYKIDPDTAYARTREILKQDPKSSLQIEAESVIAQKGVPGDIAYFEEKSKRVYGSRKLAFASILSAYLSNVKDTAVFEKGLGIMSDMSRRESIKTYRKYVTFTLIYLGNQFKKGGAENEMKLAKVKQYAEALAETESDEENKKEIKSLINESFNNKSKK